MGNQFLTDHLAAVGPISILNSDSNPTEKIDPLTHLYAHTRTADFGLFWPKCAWVFFAGIFFHGKLHGLISITWAYLNEKTTRADPISFAIW